MEGPLLGPGGEDITWPDQVAPRGQKASSTRKIKPQTSNLPGVVVAGWGGGAVGQGLGVGGLESLAEGLGDVGGAEALDRIAEEGLPCRLRHDGPRGGLVGVCGGAGAHRLEGMHHVHPIVPSRSPGPLHPAAELLQSGGRPSGEVGGALGGGEVRARGPGAAGRGRGPVVVLGPAVGGRAGAAVAGAGGGGRVRAEGGTGGGGGHGAAVACLVASGGAGVPVAGATGGDGYGRRAERGARRGLLGEGEVDMGRLWRSWWRPGERERQERGPGVSWWCLGERERREWLVEAGWRCGECGRRGRVCRAGGERERRRLRDQASSLESGQSGGVGGSWGASRGAALYWMGGGRSPVVHVGVWWRQRLVVWVE